MDNNEDIQQDLDILFTKYPFKKGKQNFKKNILNSLEKKDYSSAIKQLNGFQNSHENEPGTAEFIGRLKKITKKLGNL